MQTTVSFLKSVINSIQSMTNKEKYAHTFVWIIGLFTLNWSGFDFTMLVFYSSDNSLLIASIYGTILNAALFYGIVVLVKDWFRRDTKVFFKKILGLFLTISIIEMGLDLLYYYLFHENLPSWVIYEIIIGTLLLNGLFFLISGLVYGIIKDWKSVEIEKPDQKIIIKDGSNKLFLNPSDIYFIKSDGNYVVYQTKNGKIMVRNSLSSILKDLPKEFIRSHRSYIVNSTLIEKKTYDQLEIVNHKIPIGRTFSEVFK